MLARSWTAVVLVILFQPELRKVLRIDGTGAVIDGTLTMEPSTAVRHRPAAHADGPPASGATADCVNDCRPLG